MKPYLADSDFTLYNGDALEVLRTLPDESVHMCVTSPPFYGLRDYGTGTWEGGDAECDHVQGRPGQGRADGIVDERFQRNRDGVGAFKNVCKCGATRIDRQIGLEETPEQWVQKLVEVFREVRRVLRRDGTLWLEVGDSYAGGGPNRASDKRHEGANTADGERGVPGHKAKDLIGAPWLLAFALRADGWYLRSDIIWSRPNPMPESVTDRPTKSHSYVFLLSKSPRYFFDQEAVREKYERGVDGDGFRREHGTGEGARQYVNHALDPRVPTAKVSGAAKLGELIADGLERNTLDASGRNIRSVWNIATQPYPEAHFATYPEELVRRCILAGTSERGCCPECGGPWVRETSAEYEHLATRSATAKYPNAERTLPGDRGGVGAQPFTANKHVTTLGWHPSCEALVTSRPDPCTVLDPFSGSGTTALVARKHGRKCIGIELSADYCELSAKRLSQLSLLSEVGS